MIETKEFQTESKQLLNLMINSIYTNKEIFLRELISNASDAIDKYKYLQLTSEGKLNVKDYQIYLVVDKENRTLTIKDNGIGMSHDDLVNSLGTIASSGSKEFLKKYKEAKDSEDLNIIGQFGVGFYSAFMVASKIEVLTKTVDDKAYKFSSDGVKEYTIEEATKEDTGTEITLYLKEDKDDENYSTFLEYYTLEDLVKKYSDYIRYPIKLDEVIRIPKKDEKGEEIKDEYFGDTEYNYKNQERFDYKAFPEIVRQNSYFNMQFGTTKLRFQHAIWYDQTQISIWSSLGALAEKLKNGFCQKFL